MKQSVLVVEDNSRNLKLFKFILVQLGYRVLTAGDGLDGVETARRELPDLILMDIQMPRLDGEAALKILKKDEITREIPVIVLTAHAMKGDRERLLAAGFADYISKPIEQAEFIACIERGLAGRRLN